MLYVFSRLSQPLANVIYHRAAHITELRAAAAAAVAYNRVEYHTLFLLKQKASCKSIKFIVI